MEVRVQLMEAQEFREWADRNSAQANSQESLEVCNPTNTQGYTGKFQCFTSFELRWSDNQRASGGGNFKVEGGEVAMPDP